MQGVFQRAELFDIAPKPDDVLIGGITLRSSDSERAS